MNNIEEEYDERYGSRNAWYDLRPRKPRSYLHLYTMIEAFLLTQFPIHKGLCIFGEARTKAVIEEFEQLQKMNVINHVGLTN